MKINTKIKKSFAAILTISSFFSFAQTESKPEFGQLKSEGRRLYLSCVERDFKFCETYQYHLRHKDKSVEAIGPMISRTGMKHLRHQLLMTNIQKVKEVKESNVTALTPGNESDFEEGLDPSLFYLAPITRHVAMNENGQGLKIVPLTLLADLAILPGTAIGWSVAAMVKACQRKQYRKASYALTGMNRKKKVRVSEDFFDKLVDSLRNHGKESNAKDDTQS